MLWPPSRKTSLHGRRLELRCPNGTSPVRFVEDDDGGRVFVHGHLAYAWDGGDCAARRSRSVRVPTHTDLFGTSTEFVEAGPDVAGQWDDTLWHPYPPR